MADRGLLRTKDLPEFSRWLQDMGWTIEQMKGYFEVLRATRSSDAPLIYYQKSDAVEHVTCPDGQSYVMARKFIRWRKKRKNIGTRRACK